MIKRFFIIDVARRHKRRTNSYVIILEEENIEMIENAFVLFFRNKQTNK